MLERVWRKGDPLALLVGMQIDTATMEKNMEIPSKTKSKTNMTQQPHSWAYTLRKHNSKEHMLLQCSLQHYLQ